MGEGPKVATQVHIDDYRPPDARAIVEMWRASFEHGVGIVDHHPIEDQLAYFLEGVVPGNRVRVARTGDEIVAFMGTTPESVSQLYVRVSRIGQGIGTRLLDIAKAESIGRLWLYTFARNAAARRFYEHHGFRETERESENMWKIEAIRYEWVREAGGTRP